MALDHRRALVALALAACSRPLAAGPSASVDHVAPGAGAVEAGLSGAPDAAAPADGERAIALSPGILGDYPPPEMDMAPGELPSPAFPAGTVYVGRDHGAGLRVTEWNLATRVPRREVTLPLADGVVHVRLLRSGDALHAVAWSFEGDAAYARLTADLRVLSTHRLGTVSATGPMALASDGALTIVVAAGEADQAPPAGPPAAGVYAATFDGAGRLVATRRLQGEVAGASPVGLRDSAVVIGGRAFVVLRSPAASALELFRLDTQLNVERRTTVRAPEVYAGGVRAPALDTVGVALSPGDHGLRLRAPGAGSSVEVSFEGEEIRRVPETPQAAPCSTASRAIGHDVRVGASHVTLSYGVQSGRTVPVSIRWSDASGDAAPGPGCPGTGEANRDATSAGDDR